MSYSDGIHRNVAVLLKPNLVKLVAWWAHCVHGVAVFVLIPGDAQRRVLCTSAHLPDRSDSDEAYAEALNG